ncbi:MAG: UDP-glucuronic acid decarboxylase family protein [Planctomycetota bacterium]|nr:UDP-glucuronic acid decarboxylase family protein [Planctomycetota bacterium]
MGTQRRVLVTGGAGFLGASLCERLVQDGHEVICLDNLLTSSIDNIEHLLGSGNFKFIEHDVTEPIRLEVDEIYNLACPASPIHYQANPIKTMKTSVLGMIHVLGMAKRCGARVLQASTSEIYGDPGVHPQPESYRGLVNTLGPRACYDEGKRAAEALCSDYRRSHDVEVRIARIFNTYGPGMATNDGRVVSNFILQTLRGEPVTVYGDGSQTRSFCYRDDLIEGLVRLMALDGKEPRPVNLGNPEECSMLELVQAVARACGREATVTYQPIPNDDPKQRCPDITRARELLNWSPAVSLQEGLQRTVSWFQNQT